jgi:hypothetical protein
MVKDTTEVLKGIASDQGNNLWNVLSHCEIVAALSLISVILEQNRITTAAGEGSPFGLQIADVLVGPF